MPEAPLPAFFVPELSETPLPTLQTLVTFFLLLCPTSRKGVIILRDFEALFTQYFARVYRFARGLTGSDAGAEELTQQTFFKALKSLDQFQGRSDPATWLCSIAKHEYINGLRHWEQTFPPDGQVFDGPSPGIDAGYAQKEETLRLHRHLHALGEPYREVFMLRVFGELKYAQIAGLFGRTESWARVTYYRAKLELQRKMEEEEHE